MLIQILFQQPLVFVLVVSALIISLTFHEFAHAFVANKLGDNTAKILGRLTLDPRAHLDPIGTLMLLVAGFGWGRPVPFNPINLKNPKRDSALISFAGPLSNFTLALLLSFLIRLVPPYGILGIFLYYAISFNLVLGVFNLLPIHPLDGFKVVAGMLPPNLYIQWMQLQPYGMYFLLVLIVTRSTNVILEPIINVLTSLLGL